MIPPARGAAAGPPFPAAHHKLVALATKAETLTQPTLIAASSARQQRDESNLFVDRTILFVHSSK
jgi:hypothetical protein